MGRVANPLVGERVDDLQERTQFCGLPRGNRGLRRRIGGDQGWFGRRVAEDGSVVGVGRVGGFEVAVEQEGGGCAAQAPQFLPGLLPGFFEGGVAAVDAHEDRAGGGPGFAERDTLGAVGAGPRGYPVVLPDVGLGAEHAAEEPFAAEHAVHLKAFAGVAGTDHLEVVLLEGVEIGAVFADDELGLGVESGLEGVHGRGGLARGRAGAGGELGVAAIGLDLTLCGHGGPRVVWDFADGPGGVSCFDSRVAGGKWGFGGRGVWGVDFKGQVFLGFWLPLFVHLWGGAGWKVCQIWSAGAMRAGGLLPVGALQRPLDIPEYSYK
jgi:hypothetical protein